MPRSWSLVVPALLVTIACGSGTSSSSQTLTLRNDDVPTTAATFDTLFQPGEAAAAIFGPVADTATIQSVSLLLGGGGAAQTVTLRLYADTGGANPGALLHDADYPLTSSNGGLQSIDLRSAHIVIPDGSSFRVAVFFQHAYAPGPAYDGTLSPGRNFIYGASTWISNFSQGFPGDWVIRTTVKTN